MSNNLQNKSISSTTFGGLKTHRPAKCQEQPLPHREVPRTGLSMNK